MGELALKSGPVQREARKALDLYRILTRRGEFLETALPRLGTDTSWELITEGDIYYSRLLDDIKNAKSSIYIEVYIIEPDRVGQRVMNALAERARNGVDVKLIVDGLGSLRFIREREQNVVWKSIPLKIYRPINLFSIFRWRSSQRRDHRKLVSIDGKICYIGGMNIKEAFSLEYSGGNAWMDLMMRLDGPPGEDANSNFLIMWKYIHSGPIALSQSFHSRKVFRRDFLIVENIPLLRRIRYRVLFQRAIRSAKKSIYIQTAYFIPRFYLVRSLRKKAEQGVDVCIILNENSDVKLASWAGRALYSFLMKKSIRVFERKGRFSHAKYTVIDNDLSILGSTNMDYRSFMHNLEVDVISRRIDLSKSLIEHFNSELKYSREILLHLWRKRGWKKRIIEKTAYLFRYWL